MRATNTNRTTRGLCGLLIMLALVLLGGTAAGAAFAQDVIHGEQLDPADYGAGYVETLDDTIARHQQELLAGTLPLGTHKDRNGRAGVWSVPSARSMGITCSGTKHIVNKWGDTQMGVGFPQRVDVLGAFVSTPAEVGVRTTGLRALGYRAGLLVAKTEWFETLSEEPIWFAMNLTDVDRLEIQATPVYDGAGWYALDDLTYTLADGSHSIVVDFDDLPENHQVTGTGYAGLTWEYGAGNFDSAQGIPSPKRPDGVTVGGQNGDDFGGRDLTLGLGTLPDLVTSFAAVNRGEANQWSYPPDTHGAVGPNHFVTTVNTNFAVHNKQTGFEITNIPLSTFLPGSSGDPRVLFDQHSGRWIVMVTNFSSGRRIYLAVSLTDDPTGAWFKTNFYTANGSDAGRWPDYPTLGVDEYGIYTAAYMVGGNSMTIFAVDKAPLIAASPSLGTVTAFRDLPWEGAIQPVHTFGSPGGQYFVSIFSDNGIRVRRLDPPLTNPTLQQVGIVSVTAFDDPPNAPALGSSVALDTVDARLMMSLYRDGHIWTCHTVQHASRAACRWYDIDVATLGLVQTGTVADASLYYFFPSMTVNQNGDVAMGFTGSNATTYASCYYTGRRVSDPLGEMATPALYHAGAGPQNNIDGLGRNRWGDYSYTTLDPLDQHTMWTIQSYGHATNIWGSYTAAVAYGSADCDSNGIPDTCDISCGATGGYCDVPGCGAAGDCNLNQLPDVCDILSGDSGDGNGDGIPDECQLTRLYVDAGATGGNYGSSWADAMTSLADALDMAAPDYSPVTEIWIAQGVYTPTTAGGSRSDSFVVPSGVTILGGFAGGESDALERNPALHPVVLSGDLNGDDTPGLGNIADNSYHVLVATHLDAPSVVDGLVVTGGNTNGDTFSTSGAGLYLDGGDLTVRNTRFVANSALIGGGAAIFNGANATFENCVLAGNGATVIGAGAVAQTGSHVTFDNCAVAYNTANSAAGGLYISGTDTTATIRSSIVWANSDNSGSGEIAQLRIGGGTVVTVDYSCVMNWSGTLGGSGNTGSDPLFVDAAGGDGALGTLDDDLRLAAGSPGIDAGDPALAMTPGLADLDHHGRVICGRVDMGPYENGIGDYACDQAIDLVDFAGLQNCFGGAAGAGYAPACGALDFDADAGITLADFAAFEPLLAP